MELKNYVPRIYSNEKALSVLESLEKSMKKEIYKRCNEIMSGINVDIIKVHKFDMPREYNFE